MLRDESVPLALACLLAASGSGYASAPTPNTAEVRALVGKYCYACHGATKHAGKIRLDQWDYDLVAGPHADRWQEALGRLDRGEMPPENEPQPSDEERRRLTGWLREQLQRAAQARSRVPAGVVMRRLNRQEYANTLRDLLDIPIDFSGAFPPEGLSPEGFTNNGQTLGMSPLQVEYYFQTARQALAKAIVLEPRPEKYHYRVHWQAVKGNARPSVEWFTLPAEVARRLGKNPINAVTDNFNGLRGAPTPGEDGVVLPPATPVRTTDDLGSRRAPGPNLIARIREYPTEGEVRIRVKASAEPDAAGNAPLLAAVLGNRLDDGNEYVLMGAPLEVRATADAPQIYEFRGRLENFPLPFVHSEAKAKARTRDIVLGVYNAYITGRKDGPQLRVDHVELEGPLSAPWPPASHRRIFVDSPNAKNEDVYVREILRSFMRRAYRRPAADEEVEKIAKLWKALRPGADSFEHSVRDVLPAVLASPRFLYLVEPRAADTRPRPLTGHELATRLSYFLWSGPPDDELAKLADAGTLLRPDVLAAQVARMIDHPQSDRFVDTFTREWLDLDALGRVTVKVSGFTYYRALEDSIRLEPSRFVRDLLRSDLSALNCLDSDFAVVDPELARHYGIANVEGAAFRRVPLQAEHHRGGLLSMAAFLVGQSTGSDSHPIKRAVWLKKRLLDDPPPPPPPNVPELDNNAPDAGMLTLRARLEAHRARAACAACHRAIDPWGLPFEQYDAVGRWRGPKGKAKGIDATAQLPDATKIDGLGELKAYLLEHKKDEFARALVRKLLAYALGRSLVLGDSPTVDRLTADFARRKYRLRPLIADIVSSELFTVR